MEQRNHAAVDNDAQLPNWRHIATFSLVLLALFLIEPAHAQEWATKVKSTAESIVAGLRMLCYPIALGVGVWVVYGLWMGTKRLQDMVPWLVGVALLIALPDLVKLIPTT